MQQQSKKADNTFVVKPKIQKATKAARIAGLEYQVNSLHKELEVARKHLKYYRTKLNALREIIMKQSKQITSLKADVQEIHDRNLELLASNDILDSEKEEAIYMLACKSRDLYWAQEKLADAHAEILLLDDHVDKLLFPDNEGQ